MARNKRTPKYHQAPQPQKIAKHQKDPEGYQNQHVAWHFQCMDNGGNWPCGDDTIMGLKSFLLEYEKMIWSEALKSKSNHPMPLPKICRKAQKRLSELEYTNAGNLYQLKIRGGKGRQRLWGIRIENIFQILWWDPNHTVYPLNY